MKLEDKIKQLGITEKQALELITEKTKTEPTKHNLDFAENHTKFGVISDLHCGHKEYRPYIMDKFAKHCKKEAVDFVCIPGDLCEGMSGRDGHILELTHLGATEQMKYLVSELSKIDKKLPIYFITASQSHDGWFSSKSNVGFELGPELELKLPNTHFLGYDEADLKLNGKSTLRMVHPGGGTAYALSYMGQKYINSLTGGQKPNIVLSGHYHKAMQMLYRNIHYFECGTLEGQTIFMKKKGSPSMLGYFLIDAYMDKKGIERIKSEFVPFYD